MRILFARTREADRIDAGEPEVFRIETRMLTGQNQGRLKTVRNQRVGNRFEFYGFGSGPDDQPDIGETQPSP